MQDTSRLDKVRSDVLTVLSDLISTPFKIDTNYSRRILASAISFKKQLDLLDSAINIQYSTTFDLSTIYKEENELYTNIANGIVKNLNIPSVAITVGVHNVNSKLPAGLLNFPLNSIYLFNFGMSFEFITLLRKYQAARDHAAAVAADKRAEAKKKKSVEC